MSFRRQCAVARLGCHTLDFIEQHRFADAAQPCEQNAFLGPSCLDATQQYPSLLKYSLVAH
jgi:hypothetical protein